MEVMVLEFLMVPRILHNIILSLYEIELKCLIMCKQLNLFFQYYLISQYGP